MANTNNDQMGIMEDDSSQPSKGQLRSITIDFGEGGASITPSYEGGEGPSPRIRPTIVKGLDDLVSEVQGFASEAGLSGQEDEEGQGMDEEGMEAPEGDEASDMSGDEGEQTDSQFPSNIL